MDIVKINDYPFLFTWDAYKEFIRSYDDNKDSFDYVEFGIYLGFKHGAKQAGGPELSMDQFKELFNSDDEFGDKSVEAFKSQMPAKKKRWEKLMEGAG